MRKYSSSVCNINYHFVWCTKYRKPYLAGISKDVKSMLEKICLNRGWTIKELRVMPEHVHLFLEAPPYDSPTGIIKVLKGTTAIWIFKKYSDSSINFRKGHVWSPSYYVGTAGHVSAKTIERYIREQCLNSFSQQVGRSP